jgi:hypothetical protein
MPDPSGSKRGTCLLPSEALRWLVESFEKFEGRCQCGQVRYRVTGQTVALFICHCTECQRQSASAFGMALWLRNYSKNVLEGKLRTWVRTTPTGRQLVCEFCSRCGTRVFHQMKEQFEIMSIKPGTLDTMLDLEPVAHIWTSRARSWVRLPEGILSFPENPSSFDEIFAAWQVRKRTSIAPDVRGPGVHSALSSITATRMSAPSPLPATDTPSVGESCRGSSR